MKIVMLVDRPTAYMKKGETYNVDDADAKRMIEAGKAKAATSTPAAKPEKE